jgi:hypothetical protein
MSLVAASSPPWKQDNTFEMWVPSGKRHDWLGVPGYALLMNELKPCSMSTVEEMILSRGRVDPVSSLPNILLSLSFCRTPIYWGTGLTTCPLSSGKLVSRNERTSQCYFRGRMSDAAEPRKESSSGQSANAAIKDTPDAEFSAGRHYNERGTGEALDASLASQEQNQMDESAVPGTPQDLSAAGASRRQTLVTAKSETSSNLYSTPTNNQVSNDVKGSQEPLCREARQLLVATESCGHSQGSSQTQALESLENKTTEFLIFTIRYVIKTMKATSLLSKLSYFPAKHW